MQSTNGEKNTVFVATEENSEGTNDTSDCFIHPEEHSCKTLAFAMYHTITNNLLLVSSIFFNGNYSSSHVETVVVEHGLIDNKSLTISCLTSCVVHIHLKLLAEYFSQGLVVHFQNIIFRDSLIQFCNVNLRFSETKFINTNILDLPARAGEFGEVIISIQNNEITNSQMNFAAVFVVHFSISKTIVVNSSLTFQSPYLWLSSLSNEIEMSSFLIGEGSLIFVCFSHDIFQNEKHGNVALSITGRRMTLKLVQVHMESTTGGIEVEKTESRFLQSWMRVSVLSSSFQNISKFGVGGAVLVRYSPSTFPGISEDFLVVANSHFADNSVKRHNFDKAYGGSLCVLSPNIDIKGLASSLVVEITNSSFTNNKAADGGGSIFVSEGDIKTTVSDCVFSFNEAHFSQFEGLFLLAYSDITVVGSSFNAGIVGGLASLLELQMFFSFAEIETISIQVECPQWHNLAISKSFGISSNTGNVTLQNLVLYCSPCEVSFYFPSQGEFQVAYLPELNDVLVQSGNSHTYNPQCRKCPPGAECPGHELKSQPNYWGEKSGKDIVFYQCPNTYCCQGTSQDPCISLDHCSGNRDGTLCGSCKPGYTVSVMSTNCVPSTECNKGWLWSVALGAAVLYMLWYTFKDDVLALPSQAVSWMRKVQPEEGVDKGYFGILTYFIQASQIMRLAQNMEDSRYVSFLFAKFEAFVSLFLSIELSYFSSDICPTEGITTTSKTVLKFLFLGGIYASWLVCFTIFFIFINIVTKTKLAPPGQSLTKMKSKFINGLIEIIKYTYSGFTDTVFFSLAYVTVNETKVWFYDGSVELFSTWQMCMIVFGLFIIIPFPFMLYLGLKMVKHRVISGKTFLLGTFLPAPSAMYWFYLSQKQNKVRVFTAVEADNQAQQEIQERFTGGFKQNSDMSEYWECTMILRRLLLSSTALIPDVFIQKIVSLVLCISFLIHHIYVQPFIHHVSNQAETFSLKLLVIVASVNLSKSIFLYMGINPSGSFTDIMRNLNLVETMCIFLLISFIIFREVCKRKQKVKQ